MRFLIERGVRNLFYVIIGFSMVLVITPSLAGAIAESGAAYLWPLIGLLAYLLHLFEDTGKLASILHSGRSADRRRKVCRPNLPGLIPSSATTFRADHA